MLLNIIIPARNEEEVIIRTLEDIKKNVKVKYQVIVVNDKSNDGTEEVIKKYMKNHRNIILVNNTTPRGGFGQALKLGFKRVANGYVVFVMADLCDNPRTINKMYQKLESGWDVVCGSRYMRGGKKKDNDNPLQGFLSYLTNMSLFFLVGIPTRDVSNAFKMYRMEVLKRVEFNPGSGVEASMELLGQAYFNGAKITEIPTVWTGRKFGKSKFKILKRTPRYWRIYRWILQNKIKKLIGMAPEKFYI